MTSSTSVRGATLRRRPLAVTTYKRAIALFDTPAKRRWLAILLVGAALLPIAAPNDLLLLLALGMVAAVGAIGLNLVTGYAGQVSLGHAFFIGVGAFTAAVLGGEPGRGVIGLGLPIWIWLPAAGIVPAILGVLIGLVAVRLRGLYLAIVTLGLVFVGEHFFRAMPALTGGAGVGRSSAPLVVFGFDFRGSGDVLGMSLDREQRVYLFALMFLVLFAIIGGNIARSAVGRAFQSVRDRDVAAAVIGVGLRRYKTSAFAMSSFFAGVCGAVYFSILGHIELGAFGILMSIQYLAMVLIGGSGSIAGSILGALFIALLGRISGEIAQFIPFIDASPNPSGFLSVFQLEGVLYGLLIIVFLMFEPRGLIGLWTRARNYWKAWPFSYR